MELPEDTNSRALLVALGVFVLREVWGWVKHDTQSMISSVRELSAEVSKLRMQMVYIERAVAVLEKMKPDIDVAHERVRMLQRDVAKIDVAIRGLGHPRGRES